MLKLDNKNANQSRGYVFFVLNQVNRKQYVYLFKIIAVFLICFSSCIQNSDSSEDLSGHYFYRNEGTHVKDILSHIPNRKEIYSEVVGYDFNSDFIVAEQKPVYDEYKTMIGFNLRENLKKYPTNSKEDVIQSETEADSILKYDPCYKLIFAHKINYWIIVNKDKKVLGPLTNEEYKTKRKELDIPKNIEVK